MLAESMPVEAPIGNMIREMAMSQMTQRLQTNALPYADIRAYIVLRQPRTPEEDSQPPSKAEVGTWEGRGD